MNNEQVLHAMVYAMPDPVACVDRAGTVVCWNKGASALFLVDESAALGRSLRELLRVSEPMSDGGRIELKRSDGVVVRAGITVTPAVDGQRDLVVFSSGDAPQDPRETLSPRLLEVLERLLEGQSEKQIAYDLAISQHTVHDYVKALYKKYGVASRAELLALVLPRRASPR
jgi:DNA-binding CsgD family transcriptional regulator